MKKIKLNGKFNEAVVFTEDQMIDSGATALLFNILNDEVLKDESIRVMPDYHVGKDCLVGYTQTFNNQFSLNPDIIGSDLGCGIRTERFLIKDIPTDFKYLDKEIRGVIPLGKDINKTINVDKKDFKKFLKKELEKYRSIWPEMIKFNNLGKIDKIISELLSRINYREDIFWKSLGSVGGGNHFLEIGKNKNDNNSIYITVHTGSRNLGIKIHSYWKGITKRRRLISKKELKNEEKRLKFLYSRYPEKIKIEIFKLQKSRKFFYFPGKYLYGDEVSSYICDLIFAQTYAEYSRKLIIDKVKNILNLKNSIEVYDLKHNYIDPVDKIIRKGAIKSYEGDTVIIPINMEFGTIFGKCKSNNQDWNFSCPHGAGRLLSRSEAKSILTLDDFKNSIKDVFISNLSLNIIDESPLVYKSPESILNIINEVIDVKYIIKPLMSLKGG